MNGSALTACRLCPRGCGVDRTAGETGYCRAGHTAEVYRYGPHHGEEPPVSGTRGSGTVFFSRCTLRCLYCQNYPWSQDGAGDTYTEDALAGMFRSLARAGCHNWNLVSPTPWLPMIREALQRVRRDGISLPVVYNTSGFERIETVREYRDAADLFLVDLRYAEAASAREGSDAAGYVSVARAAIEEMWRLAGPLRVDHEGVAVSGVICRLLILPGRAQEAVANLQWLAGTLGTEVAVSVMAQYMPAHRAGPLPGWNRGITAEELTQVRNSVEGLGFVHGWIQELEDPVPDSLVGFKMGKGADL